MCSRTAILLGLVFFACNTPAQTVLHQEPTEAWDIAIRVDTLTLLDSLRNRAVPIAYYAPSSVVDGPPELVVISHGYGANKTGSYLHFSSLAEDLANHGYTVVSIQHELPGDGPIAMKGDLRVLRRPNWERGVANILFVLNEISRLHPELERADVALVGHSNGGDMSMLFAETYPSLVRTVISLDNRRMPLPRVRTPRICSIRANDAPADEGVLPTAEEQVEFAMRIVHLPNTKHEDMDDRATDVQKRELNTLVRELLLH